MEWIRGDRIGCGSFASVDIAVPTRTFADQCFASIMAVKSCDAIDSAMLENEKRVLEQLGFCEQLIGFYGDDHSVEKGKKLYNLLLEYAPKGSLASKLKSLGFPFQESEVKRYTRSVLQGLHHIHAKGFAHCDIKLQNLLLFDNGDVKIADFGLAKKSGEKQGSEEQSRVEVRGTPLYMAPESVNENEYDSPCDIWALGCAVVEMISGKPAWDCKPETSVPALLIRIGVSDELPIVPEELSDEGKDFLSNCFVKHPAERWTADMLLSHPFIASAAVVSNDQSPITSKNSEKLQSSPRSPFDLPDWVSIQSSSIHVSESNMEFEPSFGLMFPSASERLSALASDQTCNWSVSNGWITVR